MKRLLLAISFLILATVLPAQGPVWNWETNCGSTAGDKALDVAISSDGYVYSCGFYNDYGHFGSIDLTPSNWSKNAYLAKQDMFGNYIWVRYCDSGLDDRALGLTIDKDGNIIITGTYWSNMTVGPYNLNGSADHVFVIKYDPAGNLIWAICGGGNGDDHGYDMVTDANGDIYITGYLSTHYGPPTCTATFGTLPQFTYTDSIAFVGKISSAGQWMWVQTFDGCDVQRDNDIAIDQQGGIYVVGGFYGANRNFGPFLMSSVANSRDIFVIKYDSNGNFQFANQVGGYNDDRANGIICGADNRLYITGEFRAEIYFDGDTLNNNGGPGGKDIFVAKMDINGGWIWASKAGSDKGGESGRGITATNQHCIFVTGQTKGDTCRFGDSLYVNTTNDSIQIFVAGIDTAGIWRWVVECGGPGEDKGYGIEADESCRLYFCGFFNGPTATFGPFTQTTYGTKDGFTARLDVTCFDYVSDTLSGIGPVAGNRCSPRISSILVPNGYAETDNVQIQNRDCMSEGEWIIYNALGQPVFVTRDMNYAWTGTDLQGNQLPSGTYFYVLNYRENNSEVLQNASGHITLIR